MRQFHQLEGRKSSTRRKFHRVSPYRRTCYTDEGHYTNSPCQVRRFVFRYIPHGSNLLLMSTFSAHTYSSAVPKRSPSFNLRFERSRQTCRRLLNFGIDLAINSFRYRSISRSRMKIGKQRVSKSYKSSVPRARSFKRLLECPCNFIGLPIALLQALSHSKAPSYDHILNKIKRLSPISLTALAVGIYLHDFVRRKVWTLANIALDQAQLFERYSSLSLAFEAFAFHHPMYIALANENELAVFSYLLGVAVAVAINNGFRSCG